jgi:hypothetical protein
LAAACALAAGAAAQSGRRKTAPKSPVPQATPEPAGESESGPRREESRANVVASFIVMAEEDASFWVDSVTRSDVLESFTTRLRRSPSVSVSDAGRGTRGEAVRRAKAEDASHVVLLAVEEEMGAPSSRNTQRADQRSLIIRTYVFAPKTGALKFSDTVYQRAVRQSVGVGGVRLPVPTRTISRYPSQLELRQAAQDAADRILSRFNARPAPDRP